MVDKEINSFFNRFYIGDCLEIAEKLPKGVFRLIYLDPPFLTGAKRISPDGAISFDDRWPGKLQSYLPWLRDRIYSLKPLLVENGSLVLHLDYRAVHYAKVMLDEIFGYNRFVNEIIWHYTGGGRAKRRFSCKHDTLLWYAKGDNYVFNIDCVRVPYKPTSGYAKSGITAASGKKYLPNPNGTPVDDVWDIPIINPLSGERTGYPTQKPISLMTRLIAALSNPGDLVGDFFCGSGSTVVAAHMLNRKWLGVDISEDAIKLASKRIEVLQNIGMC